MRFPDYQALTGSGDFERNAENPIWEIFNAISRLYYLLLLTGLFLNEGEREAQNCLEVSFTACQTSSIF